MYLEEIYESKRKTFEDRFVKSVRGLMSSVLCSVDIPELISNDVRKLNDITYRYFSRMDLLIIMFSLDIPIELAETLFGAEYITNKLIKISDNEFYEHHLMFFASVVNGKVFRFKVILKTFSDHSKTVSIYVNYDASEEYIFMKSNSSIGLYIDVDVFDVPLEKLGLDVSYSLFLRALIKESFNDIIDTT